MKKYLLVLFMISLAVSACAAESGGASASLTGDWKLVSYGSATAQTPAVEGAEARLTFNEDGTVTGNSSCNGLGGGYTVEGNRVTFSEVVMTLMACDDSRMAQEDAVQQVLTDTATFKVDGNTLTLTNGDMTLVLTK